MSEPKQPNNFDLPIHGAPLELDILLDFATIDAEDIESAAEWWDENASPEWVGALDSEPIDAL